MLIQNAVYIPEDDIYISSSHRHDYVEHQLRDGKTIAVDGGVGPDSYGRRVGDLYELSDAGRYVEWCLTDGDPFEVIAEKLLWGTRGKDGDQPLSRRPIKELAHRPDGVAHMRAILANCLNINPLHKRVVEHWLNVLAPDTAS